MNSNSAEQQRCSSAAELHDSLQEPLLPTPVESLESSTNSSSESNNNNNNVVLYDGLPLETSVLIKSLYFLDALGWSAWGRYSAIYYNIHGLNSQHIGLIECLSTAIPTLSQVMWGIVADRCHSRKTVWLLTKSVSTIILLTLALPIVYRSFINMLLVSVIAQLFVSDGILDSYTLDLLGTVNKMYYGRYRLYASLSWGIGSIIMGWITDHYNNFEPNFIIFGTLSFLTVALVANRIPDSAVTTMGTNCDDEDDNERNIDNENRSGESESDSQQETVGRLTELVRLAIRPRVAVFLLEVVIMGAAMATVERLLFLYMVNDLKASTLLCGLSVGVNVVFELPIFWYAPAIMKVFGHDGMYIFAMTCFAVRVIGYTWLTPATKWLILPLEVMHGITYACFWIVTTDISKVLVHQTKGSFWRTAIPSSIQMLYTSLGVSLGSILGGWAMNRYGSRPMYRCTASIVAITLLLHIVGSIISRVLKNGQSFLPDYSSDDNEDRSEEPLPLILNETDEINPEPLVLATK